MSYCQPRINPCSRGGASPVASPGEVTTVVQPGIAGSCCCGCRSDEPRHRRGAGGFSLIEMLVALVVLSLSLGVLYQAAMGATRNVRVATEYTGAVMLAESVLTEYSYVTDENLAISGHFGQYDWQVSSWPVTRDDEVEPEQLAAAPQALQYLEVVVSWPGRQTSRIVDLLTVVPLSEVAE